MRRLILFMLLLSTLLALPVAAQRGLTATAVNQKPAHPAAPADEPRYTITDLGTLGGDASQALGINKKGLVVGLAKYNASFYHAFLWEDKVMTDLGTLGGPQSSAQDINDTGWVVGGSALSSSTGGAFLWRNGVMQNLGTLGGTTGTNATGINNSDQVVGSSSVSGSIDPSEPGHAFLWQNGAMQDLGTLGGRQSYATDINNVAQVVGYSDQGDPHAPVTHAFLWQNGTMQDLGSLAGESSRALAINNSGQVVGYSLASLVSPFPTHAFLWENGAMQDLGTLGGNFSYAYDISDSEQIVGYSTNAIGLGRAVLWENGQMKDLNTLIPADSGWVLTSAEGTNKRGQIVGYGVVNAQTHAFLLTPQAYYWINPSGGAWHLTTNWDPKGDPGAGDTVIFALNGQYTVDVSTLVSAPQDLTGFSEQLISLPSGKTCQVCINSSPNTLSIDRMVISSTNFIYFDNMNLNLVYDSPEEPSLQVNAGGTAAVNSGAATFSHAIIGGEPPANSNNPPIARLQVLGSGTSLTGSGRLTIGDEGVGNLFVTAGGHLTSAEARLGGLLPTGTGTADVGGDGSLWETGNIAVGYGVSGTLDIENGGRVNSNDAYVSYGILSQYSQVTVDGLSAITSQPSMWALLGNLFVGQSMFGSVEVLDGGDLNVSQNVYITNGDLRVDGRHANGDPSDLDVSGTVFVGGPGSANLLAFWNAAKGDIEGDLIIGKDGAGAVILWGSAITANPTRLDVVDPQAGLCAIGREYDGDVSLDDGGLLRCRNIQLGQVGTSGSGSLTVDGGMVYALDVLTVGQVGGGAGVVDMQNNALVATHGTYITPNGVITGTGTLAVGSLGLQNDGTLTPGINVLYPLAPATPSQAQATAATATMAISGTLNMGPTGQVAIPLVGNGAGQYGHLMITGTAALDGVLTLDFSNGYAPSQGDTFTFLAATDGFTGTFDSVAIGGLMPGFEYEISYANGQLILEALNDGVPLYPLFLPLVVR